jgi:hypothetical protein
VRKIYKTKLEHFKALAEVQENGCWHLSAKPHHTGYAIFQHDGRHVSGHVFSYTTYVGEIQGDNEIHHKCENRRCVNPDHLEQLPVQKHRAEHKKQITHCPSNHEYTEENTYMNRGKRHCWACIRAARKQTSAVRSLISALSKLPKA